MDKRTRNLTFAGLTTIPLIPLLLIGGYVLVTTPSDPSTDPRPASSGAASNNPLPTATATQDTGREHQDSQEAEISDTTADSSRAIVDDSDAAQQGSRTGSRTEIDEADPEDATSSSRSTAAEASSTDSQIAPSTVREEDLAIDSERSVPLGAFMSGDTPEKLMKVFTKMTPRSTDVSAPERIVMYRRNSVQLEKAEAGLPDGLHELELWFVDGGLSKVSYLFEDSYGVNRGTSSHEKRDRIHHIFNERAEAIKSKYTKVDLEGYTDRMTGEKHSGDLFHADGVIVATEGPVRTQIGVEYSDWFGLTTSYQITYRVDYFHVHTMLSLETDFVRWQDQKEREAEEARQAALERWEREKRLEEEAKQEETRRRQQGL